MQAASTNDQTETKTALERPLTVFRHFQNYKMEIPKSTHRKSIGFHRFSIDFTRQIGLRGKQHNESYHTNI